MVLCYRGLFCMRYMFLIEILFNINILKRYIHVTFIDFRCIVAYRGENTLSESTYHLYNTISNHYFTGFY